MFFVQFHSIDSYFTERYIPYNDHFNHALRESDLSMKVSKLEDKDFLIIQGTADQVVHQQHSLWLTKSLIQAGVTFRQQVNSNDMFEIIEINILIYHSPCLFSMQLHKQLDLR